MFKKLKQKFVLITMLMVTIVVFVSFTTICLVQQKKDYLEVMDVLSATVESAEVGNSTPFYIMWPSIESASESNRISPGAAREANESKQLLDSFFADNAAENPSPSSMYGSTSDSRSKDATNIAESNAESPIKPPNIGGDRRKFTEHSLTPVAVYRVETDGTLIEIKEKTTAAIDGNTLSKLPDMMDDIEDGTGTLHEVGLHYARNTISDTTYIAFADVSSTSAWKSLGLVLFIVGIGVIAVSFALTWFLSERALQPVKEAWSSQKQFVADASHDLKTPLTVVLANTSILQKHPESSVEEQMQWVDNTQHAAENMLELINEMLELASVEEMINLNPVLEDIDFSDLVESLSLSWDALAMENGVVSDLDCMPGIIVKGDEQKVSKMVSTIAENAFKYVNSGGIVKMSLDRYNKMARLRISNTGDAIDPEDLDHIFDRFYRSDKTRTSGVGGFGLGLAIARETARSHGGDIVCESSDSVGTMFTITLPLISEKRVEYNLCCEYLHERIQCETQ